MMHAVWKYTLPMDDTFSIEMPRGTKVLSVAFQGGDVRMWAEVNSDELVVERRFRMCGTGHPMPANEARRFVGTVLIHGGDIVLHLFELDRCAEDGGS